MLQHGCAEVKGFLSATRQHLMAVGAGCQGGHGVGAGRIGQSGEAARWGKPLDHHPRPELLAVVDLRSIWSSATRRP